MNLKRNAIADQLKGLAVLFMVQVHLMELFANQDVYASALGKISLFLGGPTAAPVFMGVMGYFIAASSKSLFQALYRGVKLIFLGLLLNVGINLHLMKHIIDVGLDLSPLEFIFGVDILFLAGFSVIIISILKSLFRKNVWLFGGSLLLTLIISSFTNTLHPNIYFWKFVIACFYGNYTWSYFPLLPWLAYPLAGFIVFLLKDHIEIIMRNKKFRLAFVLIASVMVLSTFSQAFTITYKLPQYYHHDGLFFLWTMVFLSLYTLVLKFLIIIPVLEPIMKYISWIGKNVTSFYVIQWLLIGIIATPIYKTQSIWQLHAWYLIIILIAALMTYAWNYYIKRDPTDVL